MVASVALWSTTPASNSGLDTGANFPEGMAPSAVNDAARGIEAAVRKMYNDGAAKIVATGSANAITITTQSSWAALADGIMVMFRAANTNSNSTVTLALDGLTAKNCYRADGSALAIGDIVSGGIYVVAYSSLANASAGGWLFLCGTPVGTVQIANGGTGQTTAAAAFAALISGSTVGLGNGGTGQTTAPLALNALITGATQDAAPDPSVDYMGTNDNSASTGKKVLLQDVRASQGTAQASTSGTSIDFTGIPAGVRRVVINFSGVSLSGTAAFLIQIGDSGGIETTGYLGSNGLITGSTAASATSTSGFIVSSGAAANVFHGSMTLSLQDTGTNWCAMGIFGLSNSAGAAFSGGAKALSPGPLDRVRITTTNGTDTFDAGSINIQYA